MSIFHKISFKMCKKTKKHLCPELEIIQDKCLELLIQAGADVNMSAEYGDNALIQAVTWAHKKCVQLLIEAGANVNSMNIYGEFSLWVAAREGCDKCQGSYRSRS